MNLDLLTAISPIDGRYRGKTERLADYFQSMLSYVIVYVLRLSISLRCVNFRFLS